MRRRVIPMDIGIGLIRYSPALPSVASTFVDTSVDKVGGQVRRLGDKANRLADNWIDTEKRKGGCPERDVELS